MTAFISYGFFWISLVGLIFMAKWGWISPTPGSALVAYLIVWGIFTLLLFFGTLRINKALQLVFGSLTILFFLLAIGDATKIESITRLAGYEGIVCGGLAIYTGIANLLKKTDLNPQQENSVSPCLNQKTTRHQLHWMREMS